MATHRVIVIGGGFAGLSAAVELARRGEKVLLLEARPRLGGRATAFTDRHTGERVDNGQHVLLGCYHETFAFLKTIGAERERSPADDARRAVHRQSGPALSTAVPALEAAMAPAWRARRMVCARAPRSIGRTRSLLSRFESPGGSFVATTR